MADSVAPIILLPHLPGGGSRGSVEHFYHFLLSYFLPLEAYISRHQPTTLTVRDCGPLNPWFEVLPHQTDLVVRPAKVLAAERAAGSDNSLLIPSWEKRSWPRRRRLRGARARILQRLGLHTSQEGNRVTLINRAPSLPFYQDAAERKTSGADRRSIPNFQELADALGNTVPLHIFEGEHLQPLTR